MLPIALHWDECDDEDDERPYNEDDDYIYADQLID